MSGNEIVYKSTETELHRLRLESEIMNCNFISAKNEEPNLRDMKRMDDNLHIIDVDEFLKGNNYINYLWRNQLAVPHIAAIVCIMIQLGLILSQILQGQLKWT